jgi:hypothetical protein
MEFISYSYRFGAEVLESPAFRDLKNDVLHIFRDLQNVPQLNPVKTRKRAGKTMTFTTNQKGLNALLDEEFEKKGWEVHPLVFCL